MVRTFTAAEYRQFTEALRVERLVAPLFSNASINRKRAAAALAAGKTPEQVAAQWPEVFALVDGKLAQLYDYRFFADINGYKIFETERTITETSLEDFLSEHAVCRHCDRRIRRRPGKPWVVNGHADSRISPTVCVEREGRKRHQPY